MPKENRISPRSAGNKKTTITYIGHATTLIDGGHTRIITDPLLRHRILHLTRQQSQKLKQATHNIDAILISHAHWDHLDIPSLKLFNPATPIITPTGFSQMLEKIGFSNITQLKVGESTKIKSTTINAVYAKHSGHTLLSQRPYQCLSFLIQSNKSIYFAGDTGLFPQMKSISKNLDITLLPIWGWGPYLRGNHLNPRTAAQALTLLQPKLAIPVHWGTFLPIGFNKILPHLLVNPPRQFKSFAISLSPKTKVKILKPNQSLTINSL